MYNRTVEQTSLPSKQFIIRGSILLGVIIIILLAQSGWVRSLFKKSAKTVPAATVGEAIIKDSNGNGIPDWEERLWGLDPTELYTGNMSNREIIESKKKALGLTNPTSDEPLNETDTIARQLFSIAMSLSEEGASIEDIQSVGAAIGSEVPAYTVTKKYTHKDIKTNTTTVANLQNYQSTKNALTEIYGNDRSAEIIINIIDLGDYSEISQLKEYEKNYKKIAEDLKNTPVPKSLASQHLDIINGLYGMAESFRYISESDKNMIIGLSGFSIYKNYSTLFDVATDEITVLLIEYGILEP